MDCNVNIICNKSMAVEDYYFSVKTKGRKSPGMGNTLGVKNHGDKPTTPKRIKHGIEQASSVDTIETLVEPIDSDESLDLEFEDCEEEYDDTCVLEVTSLDKTNGSNTPDSSIYSLSLNCETIDGESTYKFDLHPIECFHAFSWITQLPPLDSIAPKKLPHILPPKNQSLPHHEFTLVLDLDETLVHCTTTGTVDMRHLFDVDFQVEFNGKSHLVMGRLRPGVHKFLELCSQHFEVVVFTASLKIYAEKILDILDPKRQWITHRLYRDSCLQVENNYVKDLNSLGRDLQKTVIVDNSIQAFSYHLDNGIPISSWFQEEDDRELEQIFDFLISKVKASNDVTIPLIKHFRITNQLYEFVKRNDFALPYSS